MNSAERFILFLHLLGAVGMGFYLLFPFLAIRLGKLTGPAREGFAGVLVFANRIGQILLVVQLLTGGYLISKTDNSTTWMSTSIILLVVLGALTGIASKPIKRLQNSEADVAEVQGRVAVFSVLIGLVYLAILVLMYYPDML